MNILQTIVENKRKEVVEKKELYPTKLLEKSVCFSGVPISLKKYLLRDDKQGVIAEFKRKSPSKGFINKYANPESVTVGYMQAGASALSVLTDTVFFGGKTEDLSIARKFNYCPILRKDFIIDEYQIIEAKSMGADVILLIANILSKDEIKTLSKTARNLGMEILFEIHAEDELEKYTDTIDVVGVNNRNLKTMEVSIENSLRIFNQLPKECISVSESGIHSPADAITLKQAGYKGLLMGEYFMKHSVPQDACSLFIKEMNKLSKN